MPLLGGDVSTVVRIGDTVRRVVGDNAALVHALLGHLERVGFDGAPRFLGVDERGREVLTFVEGEVAVDPYPAWVVDEDRLVSVGRLLREYDDAAVTFGIPPATPGAIAAAVVPGLPDPPPWPAELVGHVDVTPSNVVFRDGVAVALIDFDLARPATRMDEVYNACMWWAPWCDPQDRPPAFAAVDPFRRARLLVDAYGLAPADRDRLVDVGLVRNERSWHLMRHRAETEGGGWARMWRDGAGDKIRRRQAWLHVNTATLRAALRD